MLHNGPHIENAEVVSVELTTPADKHLPAYDFTTLTALNTCPRWGAIRYLEGKTLYDTRRPMPLELGAACHNAFAVIRLYQLGYRQGLLEHMHYHGAKQFGDFWPGIAAFMEDTQEDELQRIRNAMMAGFHSSGFTDAEFDRKRTIANAEASLYVYLDMWEWDDVWVADRTNPAGPVGIELLVDFVVRLRVSREYIAAFRVPDECVEGDVLSVRYIGRMDGLHVRRDKLHVHENKTSGRLDEAWEESFSISHQVTGYCVFASLLAARPVDAADVIGLQVPLPRDTYKAIRTARVFRDTHHYLNWAQWLMHTMEKVWLYRDDVLSAPMYSHSCNRYFRPCSFIPLCHMEHSEAADALKEMVRDPWTPLRDYEAKTSGE